MVNASGTTRRLCRIWGGSTVNHGLERTYGPTNAKPLANTYSII